MNEKADLHTDRLFLLQAEILSEIKFPCNRTLGDGFTVAFEEEFALAEKVDAIDDVECLTYIVIGDEDAHAALTQVLDDLLYIRDSERVNARERLIEQDELRFKRKTARDFDAAALPP